MILGLENERRSEGYLEVEMRTGKSATSHVILEG